MTDATTIPALDGETLSSEKEERILAILRDSLTQVYKEAYAQGYADGKAHAEESTIQKAMDAVHDVTRVDEHGDTVFMKSVASSLTNLARELRGDDTNGK